MFLLRTPMEAKLRSYDRLFYGTIIRVINKVSYLPIKCQAVLAKHS